MAQTSNVVRLPSAASPDLKLKIFTSVPTWAIAHAARDASTMPLVQPGEVVVVEDAPLTIPEDGGLYLIEWVSPPYGPYGRERRSRAIIQAGRKEWPRPDGSIDVLWWAHPYNRPRSLEEAKRQQERTRVIICSDGPYRDELAMAEKILGPVVGILAPAKEGSPSEIAEWRRR